MLRILISVCLAGLNFRQNGMPPVRKIQKVDFYLAVIAIEVEGRVLHLQIDSGPPRHSPTNC